MAGDIEITDELLDSIRMALPAHIRHILPLSEIEKLAKSIPSLIAKAAKAEAREAAGSVRIPAPEVAPDVQEYGEKQSVPTIVNTAYKSGFVDGVNALRVAIRSMEV